MSNIYMIICRYSGEVFRNRLRNFPSLVNCTTIDWFTNWPAEALQSVGVSVLARNASQYQLAAADEQLAVEMFKAIHLSVEQASGIDLNLIINVVIDCILTSSI